MQDTVKKITDVVTILFPAVIAIAGVLNLTGVIDTLGTIEKVVTVALGALASVASIVFNSVSKPS